MSVLKVIEVMANSNVSWDDAAKKGIQKAAKSVDNIKSAWVKDQSCTVNNGKIDEYRVKLKVTFEVS